MLYNITSNMRRNTINVTKYAEKKKSKEIYA